MADEIQTDDAQTAFESVEMEISDDDILYYLVDEDDNEVGFVIEEDGVEVECYYEDYDGVDFEVVEVVEEAPASAPSKPADNADDEEVEEHGYLYKMASIAGHHGNKARKKAEVELDKLRGKAEVGAKKAKDAASEQVAKAKASAQETGITREDVTEMTEGLNDLAKEGAATAKELKEAYDDIMDSFGFLMPKGRR